MEHYQVNGMSCAACQTRVEKAVQKVPGVTSVSVSLLTNSMGVEGTAEPKDVIRAVEEAGYGASCNGSQAAGGTDPSSVESEELLRDKETPKLKRRLIFSAVFLILLMYLTMGHHMLGWPLPSYFTHNHLGLAITQMLLALIVMIINGKFFINGFRAVLHAAPNMDTLVALGSSVSFGWSLFVIYKMCGLITQGEGNMQLMDLYSGLYFESAAMIPALITVGKTLEAMSKGKTTDALKSLMKLAPATATLLRGEEEIPVPVNTVQPGDLFVVRPGESVPVDGIVTNGLSAVNESALTGESVPVDKAEGDPVSAATINQSGFLTCRATRVGSDTTYAKIIRMVSDAAATKAPIARIADKVSGVFVPVVILIAIIVLIGWLIAGQTVALSLERAICVLVISCPCALGLATPVAIMVGNGVGAKNGILFKTSEALENAGKVQIAVLDKTGTITSGEPVVTDLICAQGIPESNLLRHALALEKKSEHPLAKAIVAKAAELGIDAEAASDFAALPGNGVRGLVANQAVVGGSLSHIGSIMPIPKDLKDAAEGLAIQGKTPLLFGIEDEPLGIIAVADAIKADSADGIRQLKDLGLKTVMLTGDNERTAAAIGRLAGVDTWVAGVLPDGKEEVIRSLQKGGRVAMIGDGINDAPALMRADIGIAIGAGTDVAIDSADIVLMNSAITDVAAAIRLSRQTLVNIHENLFWAFFYNAVCIPLAAGLFGFGMNPMIGAAAMSLSSFTVCMNALRINLFDPHRTDRDRPLRGAKNVHVILPDQTGTKDPERNQNMEQTIKVNGMMCAHCEANVKKALEELPFVQTASADHEKSEVHMELNAEMNEEAVKRTIEEKGYTYLGIK